MTYTVNFHDGPLAGEVVCGIPEDMLKSKYSVFPQINPDYDLTAVLHNDSPVPYKENSMYKLRVYRVLCEAY